MTQTAVRLGGQAIIGAREEQQDAFAAGRAVLATGRSARLAVVVDGMGGHAGGAIAAGVALAAFLHTAESARWANYAETLRAALDHANDSIAARVAIDPRYRGMGCTLVAAVFDDDMLWTISVGDSLLLRVGATALERLNADHSMAPLVAGAAAMDGANEQRHLLRSALTGTAIPLIDENRFALAGEARIVLASDGLLTLAPAAILDILLGASDRDPEQQAVALLRAVEAVAAPDQDNCTVIVVDCAAPEARASWLRPAIGGVALIAGLGLLGYAWWSARDVSTATAKPRGTAAQTSRDAARTIAPVRREGYPVDPVRTPAPARPAAPRPASTASKAPVSPRGLLELDRGAFLSDDNVTAAPEAAPQIAPKAVAPPAPKSRGTDDQDR